MARRTSLGEAATARPARKLKPADNALGRKFERQQSCVSPSLSLRRMGVGPFFAGKKSLFCSQPRKGGGGGVVFLGPRLQAKFAGRRWGAETDNSRAMKNSAPAKDWCAAKRQLPPCAFFLALGVG